MMLVCIFHLRMNHRGGESLQERGILFLSFEWVGAEVRLVGTSINPSPLLVHLNLDLDLDLDVVLDVFEVV